MLNTLKLSKDLNKTTLEELVSYLRSHDIELEEDEPQMKVKSVALKSMENYEKTKAFHAEEEEESEEDFEEEDELSLLSRCVNQLWKKRQSKSRGPRRIGGHSEFTYGLKKSGASKEIIYFWCNEPGHYKNECPKLKKDKPRNKDFKGMKKGLVATRGEYESLEDDSEEEQSNMALLAST